MPVSVKCSPSHDAYVAYGLSFLLLYDVHRVMLPVMKTLGTVERETSMITPKHGNVARHWTKAGGENARYVCTGIDKCASGA